MTRLGYQIPNFTYPDRDAATVFDTVARQAVEADASGFDTVLVMDHFYQLPMLGDPEDFMLEAYTLLGALAPITSRVRLGTLVTGNTYRHPAVLAKAVTTLDVVSQGRAQLGIGAGWYELEHRAYGIDFGTFSERFEKLDEALRIVIPMMRGERVDLDGRHYRVDQAFCSPAPIGAIPVMIGGAGERKTLRMVAQYADESNLICDRSEIPHKLEVLAGHCERFDRDPTTVTVTWQRSVCIAETSATAEAEFLAGLERRGLDPTGEAARALRARYVIGDPDTVGEVFAADLALGLDGFTVNMPANGHVPGRVALLGGVLSQIVN